MVRPVRCRMYGCSAVARGMRARPFFLDETNGVVANGRPAKFPVAGVANARGQAWFEAALRTRSGDEYATANVDVVIGLDGAEAATYATAIREGGASDGKIAGVLAVFFDWTKQASAVLNNVRLSNEERARTRSMIVEATGQVIANSGQTSRDTKR